MVTVYYKSVYLSSYPNKKVPEHFGELNCPKFLLKIPVSSKQ
jgi:hypothetical protein